MILNGVITNNFVIEYIKVILVLKVLLNSFKVYIHDIIILHMCYPKDIMYYYNIYIHCFMARMNECAGIIDCNKKMTTYLTAKNSTSIYLRLCSSLYINWQRVSSVPDKCRCWRSNIYCISQRTRIIL